MDHSHSNHSRRHAHGLFAPLLLLAVLLLSAACSSIDCPIESRVYANYYFRKISQTADTLKDTLDVKLRLPYKDTLVYNSAIGVTNINIPMSFREEEDMLLLEFRSKEHVTTRDTIWVRKENHPHLESVDCAPKFFHTLMDIHHTRNRIERIIINDNEVTYGKKKENIYVYLYALD